MRVTEFVSVFITNEKVNNVTLWITFHDRVGAQTWFRNQVSFHGGELSDPVSHREGRSPCAGRF